MAFGPIMQFSVGDLQIELAPQTRESMSEFIDLAHGGDHRQVGAEEVAGRCCGGAPNGD